MLYFTKIYKFAQQKKSIVIMVKQFTVFVINFVSQSIVNL